MNFRKALLALVSFFIIAIGETAYAQQATDLSRVKVDELTDSQIRQLIQRAQSVGYTTNAQIEQMAQAQGLPAEEVPKLDQRLQDIKKADSRNADNNTTNLPSRERTGFSDNNINNNNNTRQYYNPDSLQNDTTRKRRNSVYQQRDIFGNLVPKVFGADLFKNSHITFEPNLRLATPQGYVIGPDDQLLLDITGDNEASYQLNVSPEGTIKVQYAGIIAVGGLTIEQATSKIKNTLARTYPGIRSGRTQVAINLGNIRSIKVSLVGEVVQPGTYTLPSLATVFNALSASGGPANNGSFRNIQVIRNNKVIATIDVYDFLLRGVQRNNVRLQDQDVINIPVYKTRVEMSGEVKRPALYEVKDNETLQDVISFAGGFTDLAYTATIKILQNTSKERRIADVNSNEFASYHPANGDKVVVETILNRFENRVTIEGAVFRPGRYELDKGLTLRGLIAKAEGIREDAFLNRGYINRLNVDNTLSLISFDVQQVLNGTAADIPLQREDKVTIKSIFDMRDEYKVQIQGEVRNPGTFKYADNMSLEALVQMAGGFKEGATPNRIEISRRVKNSDARSSSATIAQIFVVNIDANLKIVGEPFILQPFDIVSVRSSEGYQVQKTVSIQGEVLYPGIYTIQRKDERISDLIKRAGGLTALAFPEGASLKRPGPPKSKAEKTSADSIKLEEEHQRLLNLRRLQLAQGVKDTVSLQQDSVSIRSDMVGIDLVTILKKPQSRNDLLLEDGDIINVPKELQTIRVSGEVLKPTNIIYKPGKSMEEYINESGGFTYNANKRGAYIEYANGSIRSTRKFLFFYDYPAVKPGGEIFVPKHPPREKIGITGIVGLSTALASLAAILVTILK